MKRVLLLVVAVMLLSGTEVFAGVIEPARLRYIEGEVMLHNPDVEGWQKASINAPLDEGDSLWSPQGAKAEIELADGSILRVNGGSRVNILSNEKDFFHVNLSSGRIYVKVSPYALENSLQIDADDTTVLPDVRTRLRLDMLANSQEDVAIFKGAAYVEGNGNRTKVRAGEHIALEESHTEILPLNPPDSWETWNVGRDRMQSVSTRGSANLPEELRTHSSELDANGTWVNSGEYGMVWRPVAAASSDWAPYSSGRWEWRGDDYVWIAAEPWGWVPYHYGRWTVVSGFGWCWIPPARGDVYWGPGYVGWFQSGNSIAWTPLAPGEIFYGYGYYGRSSINISTTVVNVNTIHYRNREHRGGIVHLPHNDFVRGGVVTTRQAFQPSVSLSVSIGSPRVRPVREVSHSTVKDQRPDSRWPRVEHRDSRELRDRFPRVSHTDQGQKGEIRPQRSVPVNPAPTSTQQQRVEPPFVRPANQPQQGQQPVQFQQRPQQQVQPQPQPQQVQPQPVRQPQLQQPSQPPQAQSAQPAQPQRLNPPFVRGQQVPGGQKAEGGKAEKGKIEKGKAAQPDKRIWRVREPEQGGKEQRDSRPVRKD